MSDFEEALKGEAEQAVNLSEQEEVLLFDKFFTIDPTKDLHDIKKTIGRVRKDPRFGRMASQWDYERDKERGNLKYSDRQLKNQQWEQEDFNLAGPKRYLRS